MILWLKNSGGKPDAMLTFAFGGFIFTGISVILSFVQQVTVGSHAVQFTELTASHVALLTMYLGSTLTAYVNRRNTKDENEAKLAELRLKKELGLPIEGE